ncbi:MAG: alpha/beta hydrolase, partial [Lewinellaceae bacterium]|nr:alpha/beta hydrolase [Lewinellaceae bacterium]
LVCMKLCLAAPQRVKAAFLLNPGCLQPFSLSVKNLYYNLLPIVFPYRKSVQAFLDKAIFCKPHHQVSRAGEELIVKYELFALNRFVDRTQKPYHMNGELGQVRVDTYLLVGGRDLLFPAGISINQAVNSIPTLKDVMLFEQVGHGIETYGKAIGAIGRIIRRRIPITI